MKNQVESRIVLTLASLFFIALVVGLAVAQTAPQGNHPTWSNSGYGITVTIVPSTTTNQVNYEVTGTGKNGGPKIDGETGKVNVPNSCPRNSQTGAYYSEDYTVKLDDGTTATLRVVYKPDCSRYAMRLIVGERTYELFKDKKR